MSKPKTPRTPARVLTHRTAALAMAPARCVCCDRRLTPDEKLSGIAWGSDPNDVVCFDCEAGWSVEADGAFRIGG